jgi:transposase InsO family protein
MGMSRRAPCSCKKADVALDESGRYATDHGYAERFVGVFKLAGASRRPYHTLVAFLRAAEAWINFYNLERPYEGLDILSPLQFAQQHELEDIPSLALLCSLF